MGCLWKKKVQRAFTAYFTSLNLSKLYDCIIKKKRKKRQNKTKELSIVYGSK